MIVSRTASAISRAHLKIAHETSHLSPLLGNLDTPRAQADPLPALSIG
jgi:hypothetical protein